MKTEIANVCLYARVSTSNGHQDPEMQLVELRQYATARGWTIAEEYIDQGVSGSKESRPALNRLMVDAHRRKFDAIIVWKLDRFARSLKHLVNALAEFDALGVAFISLRDNLDLSTPAGRLMFQIIGAMAEFERSLIQERVKAGLAHARCKGVKLGRPRRTLDLGEVAALSQYFGRLRVCTTGGAGSYAAGRPAGLSSFTCSSSFPRRCDRLVTFFSRSPTLLCSFRSEASAIFPPAHHVTACGATSPQRTGQTARKFPRGNSGFDQPSPFWMRWKLRVTLESERLMGIAIRCRFHTSFSCSGRSSYAFSRMEWTCRRVLM
jgi:DNA invertase Pin-like site-specific DNA recombinase